MYLWPWSIWWFIPIKQNLAELIWKQNKNMFGVLSYILYFVLDDFFQFLFNFVKFHLQVTRQLKKCFFDMHECLFLKKGLWYNSCIFENKTDHYILLCEFLGGKINVAFCQLWSSVALICVVRSTTLKWLSWQPLVQFLWDFQQLEALDVAMLKVGNKTLRSYK